VAQCLGRQAGLSVSALADAKDDNLSVAQRLRDGMSCCSCASASKQIPEMELDEDGKHSGKGTVFVPPRAVSLLGLRSRSPAASKAGLADYDCDITSAAELEVALAEPTPQTLVGTALVMGHMTNQKTLPVVELAERRAAASEFFKGARVPGIDHDFDELCSKARAGRVACGARLRAYAAA
jgi:hypothetical protein